VAGPLKTRILEDIKTAMKAGDKTRLACLRLIASEIKQREVDGRIELDDRTCLEVLAKMIKQRKDSITQFTAGGRDDLVAKESYECEVIQGYLPEALSEAELDVIVEAAVAETGASGPKDMGRAMAVVKARAQGRADMGVLSARLKKRLGG